MPYFESTGDEEIGDLIMQMKNKFENFTQYRAINIITKIQSVYLIIALSPPEMQYAKQQHYTPNE